MELRPVSEAGIRVGFAARQSQVISDALVALQSAKHEADGGDRNWYEGKKWRYKVSNADRHLVRAYLALKEHFESREVEKLERAKMAKWHLQRRATERGVQHG